MQPSRSSHRSRAFSLRALVAVLLFSVLAPAQELHHTNGFMMDLMGSESFTLLPLPRGDTTIIPDMYHNAWGSPLKFTLTASPGVEYTLAFTVYPITYCGGVIVPWLSDSAAYWNESGTWLDARAHPSVRCDSAGVATFNVGVTIPRSDLIWYNVYIGVVAMPSAGGDTLRDTGVIEVEYIYGLPGPPATYMTSLVPGHTYTLNPEPPAGTITPRVNGKEVAWIDGMVVPGPIDTMRIDWWGLQEYLTPDDDEHDTTRIPIERLMLRVRETGQILDPHVPSFIPRIDLCAIHIDIGFTVTLPPDLRPGAGYSAWIVGSGTYPGTIRSVSQTEFDMIFGIQTANEQIPETATLLQNFPNPFNPSTTLRFSLTEPQMVRLTITDATGRRVTTLVDGLLYAGWHDLSWDGSGCASGAYFVRLETPNRTFIRRLLLLH